MLESELVRIYRIRHSLCCIQNLSIGSEIKSFRLSYVDLRWYVTLAKTSDAVSETSYRDSSACLHKSHFLDSYLKKSFVWNWRMHPLSVNSRTWTRGYLHSSIIINILFQEGSNVESGMWRDFAVEAGTSLETEKKQNLITATSCPLQ